MHELHRYFDRSLGTFYFNKRQPFPIKNIINANVEQDQPLYNKQCIFIVKNGPFIRMSTVHFIGVKNITKQ